MSKIEGSKRVSKSKRVSLCECSGEQGTGVEQSSYTVAVEGSGEDTGVSVAVSVEGHTTKMMSVFYSS